MRRREVERGRVRARRRPGLLRAPPGLWDPDPGGWGPGRVLAAAFPLCGTGRRGGAGGVASRDEASFPPPPVKGVPAARVGLGCSLRALPEVRGGEAAFFSLKKHEVLAPV